MLLLKLSILTTIIIYSISSLAYAPEEGNITSYFGPYLYKTNFKGSDTGATSPLMLGLGLVVNGDVNTKGSLEIALFFLNKTYYREEAGKFIAEQTALTHFTMGYRRWFTDSFSSSLSFSSGYSMGTPRIVHSDFPIGSEIDTSAGDTVEYGFDLSLQKEILKQPAYVVVLDARYSMSVTNKKNENSDQFGILLGFRYSVQEKNPNPNKL